MPLGAWSSVLVWLGEGGTCFSFTSWEDRGTAGGGEAVWVQGPFGHTGSGLGVLGWQEQHACSARRGRDPQGLEEARGVSLLLQLEECRAAGGGEEVWAPSWEWFGCLWASRAVCLLHWEREGPPEFPRETGLILRCAEKVRNPFQTKQGNRPSRRDQEGRQGVSGEARRELEV